VNIFVVAVVVLQVVDTPRSEIIRIYCLVVEGAGPSSACFCAGTGVNSELESLTVQIVTQVFHAGGEVSFVGHLMPIS
jgi:hypothetical protein